MTLQQAKRWWHRSREERISQFMSYEWGNTTYWLSQRNVYLVTHFTVDEITMIEARLRNDNPASQAS
jgi:hypothetical protein